MKIIALFVCAFALVGCATVDRGIGITPYTGPLYDNDVYSSSPTTNQPPSRHAVKMGVASRNNRAVSMRRPEVFTGKRGGVADSSRQVDISGQLEGKLTVWKVGRHLTWSILKTGGT